MLRDMDSHIRATLLASLEFVADRECVSSPEILGVAVELAAIPAMAPLASRIQESVRRLERLPVSAIMAIYDGDGFVSGCRGARAGRNHHGQWVCLRAATDAAPGLVRVSCACCGSEFELEYAGRLSGRVFRLPPHPVRSSMTVS